MRGAEIYGAIGGIDAKLLCRRPGVWWSPSARWFHFGPDLVRFAGSENPSGVDFEETAQLLLADGATGLTSFSSLIAEKSNQLLGHGAKAFGRDRSRQRARELALIGDVTRQRTILFRGEPASDGGYLHDETVSIDEIRRP
jgi:hypothetical protein